MKAHLPHNRQPQGTDARVVGVAALLLSCMALPGRYQIVASAAALIVLCYLFWKSPAAEKDSEEKVKLFLNPHMMMSLAAIFGYFGFIFVNSVQLEDGFNEISVFQNISFAAIPIMFALSGGGRAISKVNFRKMLILVNFVILTLIPLLKVWFSFSISTPYISVNTAGASAFFSAEAPIVTLLTFFLPVSMMLYFKEKSIFWGSVCLFSLLTVIHIAEPVSTIISLTQTIVMLTLYLACKRFKDFCILLTAGAAFTLSSKGFSSLDFSVIYSLDAISNGQYFHIYENYGTFALICYLGFFAFIFSTIWSDFYNAQVKAVLYTSALIFLLLGLHIKNFEIQEARYGFMLFYTWLMAKTTCEAESAENKDALLA